MDQCYTVLIHDHFLCGDPPLVTGAPESNLHSGGPKCKISHLQVNNKTFMDSKDFYLTAMELGCGSQTITLQA